MEENKTKSSILWAVLGFALVVALAVLARYVKTQVYGLSLPLGIPG